MHISSSEADHIADVEPHASTHHHIYLQQQSSYNPLLLAAASLLGSWLHKVKHSLL
jgi:hypothetical protein